MPRCHRQRLSLPCASQNREMEMSLSFTVEKKLRDLLSDARTLMGGIVPSASLLFVELVRLCKS